MPVLPGREPFTHDGGPVGALLVHGFTGSPASMRPWGEHLAGHGLSVACPRLPGHGTRWQELNLTRWPDWYGEVDRAFDRLRRRCDRVFVLGLSMGGTLTLKLAADRGADVAGIVLVNPSLFSLRRDVRFAPLLARFVPAAKAISDDIKAPGVTELAYDRLPLRAFVSLMELWRVVQADLVRVDRPLLLFRSAVDHVVEPQNAAAVLAGVSSTEVREVVLPDSYHVATLDNDRQRIFDESLAFVREHAGVGA